MLLFRRPFSTQAQGKKVWTEDSTSEVRSPADEYVDQKGAAEAAAATPSAPARKNGEGAASLVLQVPKSAEETQQAIDQRKDLLNNFERLVANAEERLRTEPGPQFRATLTQKIELLNLDRNTTNSEIQALQTALRLSTWQNSRTAEAGHPTQIPPDQAKPSAQHGNTVGPWLGAAVDRIGIVPGKDIDESCRW